MYDGVDFSGIETHAGKLSSKQLVLLSGYDCRIIFPLLLDVHLHKYCHFFISRNN